MLHALLYYRTTLLIFLDPPLYTDRVEVCAKGHITLLAAQMIAERVQQLCEPYYMYMVTTVAHLTI